MKANSLPRLTKGITSGALIFALVTTTSLSPVMGQEVQQGVGNAIIDALDPEAVDKRIADLEAQVDRLVGALNTSNEMIKGLETALGALAQTVASVQELGRETEALVGKALDLPEALAGDLSSEVESAIGDALETAQTGDWARGLPPDEILKAIETSRAEVKKVVALFEASRTAFNQTLQTTCKDVPTQIPGIETVVSDAVPKEWTAELASAAARAKLPLPDCLKDDNGNPNEDLRKFMADQQASQQMSAAMNSMMMAAMATGNPYVIAAAMALMVLMSIFGDNGSGGGGEGEGQGDNGDTGAGNSEAGQGVASQEGTSTGEPNSANDGQESGNETTSTTESLDQLGLGNITGTYTNVVQGAGATVIVSADKKTLTFTSTTGVLDPWVTPWGPPILPPDAEGNDGGTLPEFSDAIRFLKVNFEQKSFDLTLPIDGCDEDVKLTIVMPAAGGTLVVDPESDPPVCIGASGN